MGVLKFLPESLVLKFHKDRETVYCLPTCGTLPAKLGGFVRPESVPHVWRQYTEIRIQGGFKDAGSLVCRLHANFVDSPRFNLRKEKPMGGAPLGLQRKTAS
ncbi:MAG: hypothetical protein HYY20_00375 [Candidatus Tectomicrobia bacterium]|uniref:Uncharacterized protein n=1 Tax=Tectimicrobiota bacterium TaxID=2528274 RepID=A0A932FZF1_UNCTE|nr:hypothetical protein [Candidatus Tectomicrobia bacterium]